MYFVFAERVSEGRQYLELALAAASDDAPVDLRVELLAWLCFFAMEELDLDAAIEAGERALALSDDTPAPGESALARAMLALALSQAGDDQRAAKLAEEAREASEGGDHGTAAIVRVAGAMVAVGAGDVSTAADLAADAVRHAEAIDYLISLLAATLVEAWVAEQRDDEKAAIDAYMRVLELASQPHFATTSRSPWRRLGSPRAREGKPARGRGPVQAGARRGGCGRGTLGDRLRPGGTRPRPRRGRRRRHRGGAVPAGARWCRAAAAAPSS